MPKIDPRLFNMMYEDDEDLDIEDDEPRNRRGDKLPPPKPTKDQREWEENRKRMQYRRNFRDYD